MVLRNFALLLFLALAASSFCPAHAADSPKLKVLTSILPVRVLAASIFGDLAQVDSIVPSGADPHDFAFSNKDVKKLNEADLIVLVGLDLEGWLTGPLKGGGPFVEKRIVRLGAGLDKYLIRGITPLMGSLPSRKEHDPGVNPHFWLDPYLMQVAASNFVETVSQRFPQHASQLHKNGVLFQDKLATLDADLRAQLAGVRTVPFVTLHDAFPYLAQRYQLRLAGVVEELPDIKPSPKYLSDFYKTVSANKVKVIFKEPNVSSKLIEQIARDLKLKIGVLDPLESGDFSLDAYEKGMRRNAEALAKGLQ